MSVRLLEYAGVCAPGCDRLGQRLRGAFSVLALPARAARGCCWRSSNLRRYLPSRSNTAAFALCALAGSLCSLDPGARPLATPEKRLPFPASPGMRPRPRRWGSSPLSSGGCSAGRTSLPPHQTGCCRICSGGSGQAGSSFSPCKLGRSSFLCPANWGTRCTLLSLPCKLGCFNFPTRCPPCCSLGRDILHAPGLPAWPGPRLWGLESRHDAAAQDGQRAAAAGPAAAVGEGAGAALGPSPVLGKAAPLSSLITRCALRCVSCCAVLCHAALCTALYAMLRCMLCCAGNW